MKYRIAGFFLLTSFVLAAAKIAAGTPFFPTQFFGGDSKALSQGLVASVSNITLAEDYKTYAAAIFQSYQTERANAANPAGLAHKTKEAFLALRVPAEFTDLHLRLVVRFGLMEREFAAGDDIGTKNDGLADIVSAAPWLVSE